MLLVRKLSSWLRSAVRQGSDFGTAVTCRLSIATLNLSCGALLLLLPPPPIDDERRLVCGQGWFGTRHGGRLRFSVNLFQSPTPIPEPETTFRCWFLPSFLPSCPQKRGLQRFATEECIRSKHLSGYRSCYHDITLCYRAIWLSSVHQEIKQHCWLAGLTSRGPQAANKKTNK